MMLLWIPFLILIPFAIVWVLRPENGMTGGSPASTSHASAPGSGGPEPLEIARLRLARGEITPAEFDVIRRVLG
ncbi:MAG TPA: SHOCT domain-containing protein [Coriobacteriia bacterium]